MAWSRRPFTISVADRPQLERVLKGGVYSAALSFIHREFDIAGDLVAAIHLRQAISQPVAFQDADWTLDQAQDAKLPQICEDLKLRAGDRFLDVGCGWGTLMVYAAVCYKARATGCTLSLKQCQFSRSLIRVRGLENLASSQEMDYRDLSRRFDKIASIGMFEHFGCHRLGGYFRKIYSLLESGGRFLNSGIGRPQNVADGAETWFLLSEFPWRRTGASVRRGRGRRKSRAGNSPESRRIDYARTCREWVVWLRQNENVCVRLVGEETYRTWLLYLAASAANFEADTTNVFSVLMRKG